MFILEWAWPWPCFSSLLGNASLPSGWRQDLTPNSRVWVKTQVCRRCCRSKAASKACSVLVFVFVLVGVFVAVVVDFWILGSLPKQQRTKMVLPGRDWKEGDYCHRLWDSRSRRITFSNPHILAVLLMNQGTKSSSPKSHCQKQQRRRTRIQVCSEKLSLWFSFWGNFPLPVTS